MAKPRPSPLCGFVVDPSAWEKRSKTNGRNSGSMPIPVSATSTRTCERVAAQAHVDAVRLPA